MDRRSDDTTSETPSLLRVLHLRKVFTDPARGDIAAVDDVSFEVEGGEIYGLLGPNGAGKTTALRCIAGLLTPTGGEVCIGGKSAGGGRSPALLRELGFLAAGAALPERLTSREVLEFFGALQDISGADLDKRVAASLTEYGLEEVADTPASRLSTGMRQRVSLARASLHQPSVILLDEATSGLDPLVARSVRSAIRGSGARDRAVVFSSHIMSEVAALCDRVGVLSQGRLIAEGTPDELLDSTGTRDLEDAFVALTGGEPHE